MVNAAREPVGNGVFMAVAMYAFGFLVVPRLGHAQSAQVGRTPLLGCQEWTASLIADAANAPDQTQAPMMRMSYLIGLEFGYAAGGVDVLAVAPGLIQFPQTDPLPEWGSAFIPSQSDFLGKLSTLDSLCLEDEFKGASVPHVIDLLTADEWKKKAPGDRHLFSSDELWERAAVATCGGVGKNSNSVRGFLDGREHFWDGFMQVLESMRSKREGKEWESWMDGAIKRAESAREHMVDGDREIYADLPKFCALPNNESIPLITAAAALSDKTSAASILGPFYCKDMPPIWAAGEEILVKSCLKGLTFFAGATPVIEKPFGIMVLISNDSGAPVDVDWSQWSLAWRDKNGEWQLTPALNPKAVAHRIERNARIAAAIAGMGAGVAAGAPQTGTVYGPDGISTVVISPPPGSAADAAGQATRRTRERGEAEAQEISGNGLQHTTLWPKSTIIGVVFFNRPKAEPYELQLAIPGYVKTSFKLGQQPRSSGPPLGHQCLRSSKVPSSSTRLNLYRLPSKATSTLSLFLSSSCNWLVVWRRSFPSTDSGMMSCGDGRDWFAL